MDDSYKFTFFLLGTVAGFIVSLFIAYIKSELKSNTDLNNFLREKKYEALVQAISSLESISRAYIDTMNMMVPRDSSNHPYFIAKMKSGVVYHKLKILFSDETSNAYHAANMAYDKLLQDEITHDQVGQLFNDFRITASREL